MSMNAVTSLAVMLDSASLRHPRTRVIAPEAMHAALSLKFLDSGQLLLRWSPCQLPSLVMVQCCCRLFLCASGIGVASVFYGFWKVAIALIRCAQLHLNLARLRTLVAITASLRLLFL
jgi:hypothetical protein